MTSALNRQTAASALSRAITIGARFASRPTGRAGLLARQRGATHEGLGQGHLDVRGVDRRRDVRNVLFWYSQLTLWTMPSWAPVAVRFCRPIWNWAVSWIEMIGVLGPAKPSEPPWMALLNGCVFLPQVMLVVKAVSKTERAWAIWVSWMAGS